MLVSRIFQDQPPQRIGTERAFMARQLLEILLILQHLLAAKDDQPQFFGRLDIVDPRYCCFYIMISLSFNHFVICFLY